jgi:Peptidase propeptide and YPEB domain
MRIVFATAAFLAFLFAASTAPAQPVYVVSSADAQAIAAQNGVAVLYRMRLDEGVWKIEGRDLNGRYVYMRIDPRTGDVVQLDRGWW